MIVIAIDPGNEKSALVVWDGQRIIRKMDAPNVELFDVVRAWNTSPVIIEKVACYGMAVGEEVFETVFWSGRFAQAAGIHRVHRITRGVVKMHLCGSMRAKDGNVRQALIDRFGGKDKAIGRKATPGVLYGVSGDTWAALAVAITWTEREVLGANQ